MNPGWRYASVLREASRQSSSAPLGRNLLFFLTARRNRRRLRSAGGSSSFLPAESAERGAAVRGGGKRATTSRPLAGAGPRSARQAESFHPIPPILRNSREVGIAPEKVLISSRQFCRTGGEFLALPAFSRERSGRNQNFESVRTAPRFVLTNWLKFATTSRIVLRAF